MLEFLVPGDLDDDGGCDICDRGLLVFLVEVVEMVVVISENSGHGIDDKDKDTLRIVSVLVVDHLNA
ncbi:hypothetical protein NC652_037277 [Populus alba x Populus x berolinensis]|nr:hypothetical protein NC652_037277 [Populus alba x Populus x berolinensis]